MGPMNRTLSIFPSEQPGISRDDLRSARAAYEDQVRGLLDGGVDLLLVETIFDRPRNGGGDRRDQRCLERRARAGHELR